MKKNLLNFFLFVGLMAFGKSAFAQKPNISYTSPVTLTVGIAVTITPTHNNSVAVASATVSPALPPGLTLNSDGTITGTPTATSTATTYNITPRNAAGNAQTATPLPTINITIVNPPVFSYTGPNVFTTGKTITNLSPSAAITNATISPGLPSGLSMSATGVISGTPSMSSPSTTYTITATGSNGGTGTATVSIAVADPPVFSYSGPNIYTQNLAINTLAPSVSGGGPIISATVSPALPAGLSIANDGSISGTPTVVTGAATYTISAANSAGGIGTATVSIKVVAPPVFSYTSPNVFTTGKTITNLSPSAAITNATVSPGLPSGLSMSATGVISGTPTVASPATTYTITATGSNGGTGTATVNIAVADPPVFSYPGPDVYTKGTTITPLIPSVSSGGPVTSAGISPALPAGLSIGSDGTISGSPSAITPAANYTVTAVNSAGGIGMATVNITVNDAAPALTYPASTTLNYNVAATITPGNSGGTVISATINPALPAGLSLSAAGVISGTPTAPSPATNYVVSATNSGGTVNSNSFSISVYLAKPAFTYTSPDIYTAGTAITTLMPNNSGGQVASYTINPVLPSGLSLDGATGYISGTPTAYSPATDYVVTGTNASGNYMATINITVNQKPVIAYSPASYTFSVGTAIPSTIIPTNTGSAVGSTAFGAGTALSAPGNGPQGLAFDAAGNLYVANNGGRVKVYANATGNPATVGPSFNTPAGLVFDSGGNAFVVDNGTNTVIKVNSGGAVVTYPSPAFTNADAIAIDANNNIYVADYGAKTITGITPAGTVFLTISTNVSNPTGVAVDAAGNIYSLNNNTGTVTKYDNNGNYLSTPVSGYTNPNTLTIDDNGNIYVGETSNTTGGVYVYNPSGTLVTSVTGLKNPGGIAVDPSGSMYVSDNTNNTIFKYPATGGYYLNNALPAGLSFNTNTGQFTGTPLAGFTASTFVVTATNAFGSGSAGISFRCPTNKPNISYSPATNVYVVGTAITTLTPVNTNGAASGYAINTPLPAGLLFNPNTGTISGTPTVVSPATTYTITATNSANSNSTTVTITVNPKPPVISYPSPVSYATNVAVSITPTNTGGAATYAVSPSLPSGLGINTSTGVISGTPTAAVAAAGYTVTATNATAANTFVINITIVAPPVISYTPSTNAYPVNVAITPLAPNNTGGPVYPSGYNTGTPFASGLTNVWGITTDASGNVYVVYPNSSGAGSCIKYSPAGVASPAFSTTGLGNPVGIAIAKDGTGTIYITGKSGKIYRYTSTGGSATYLVSGISNYSAGGSNGFGMVIDGANNLYSADDLDGIIWKYNITSATLTQLISKPSTGIGNPSGITLDPGGNVDFVDYGTKSLVRYNSAGGYLSTLATGLTSPYGVYADASGNIFAGGTTAAGTVTEYSPSGTVIGNITTSLTNPRGIAESPSGILYITDFLNGTITKYLPNFYVLSGGSGTPPPGLTFDPVTGTFTGTPTAAFAATTYTVTAYGFGHIPVTTTVTISCYNSYDWVGTQTGGYWNTAANWRSGVVPTGANDVSIGVNNSFTYPPVVSVSAGVRSVTMGNRGGQAAGISVNNNITLTVSGDITKQSDINSTAAYSTSTLSGPGSIQAVNLNILANAVTAPGTYTDGIASSIANLTLSGNVALTSINSAYATNAAFTISGGVTSLTGTGTSGMIITSNQSGSTSALGMTGGTLQFANSTLFSGLASTGANTITLTGGVFDYHGAAQTVYTDAAIPGLGAGINYYGITFSGTGAKTPNGTASNNLNVAGNFTNTLSNDAGNYVTLTGTTVNFNGSASASTQTLQGGGGSGTTFTNVNFSGAQPKNMTSGMFNIAGNGILTMLGGSAPLTAGDNNNTNVYDSYTGNDTRTHSYLTLLSTAASSATVAAIPAGTSINGNVNVQRYITGNSASNYRGYRLLSNPVKMYNGAASASYQNIKYVKSTSYVKGSTGPAGGFDAAGNPNLYFFKDGLVPSNTSFTSGNYRGVNNIDTATAGMPAYSFNYETGNYYLYPGEGFLFFFRGDRSVAPIGTEAVAGYLPTNTTAYSTGILNQQNVTVKYWATPANSLDYTAVPGNTTYPNNVAGLNLVGNPYASTIDLNQAIAATPGIQISNLGAANGVDYAVYELNPSTQNYDTYQISTGLGTNSSTRYIASGQGFFVLAHGTGNTLTFTEAAKVSNITFTNIQASQPPPPANPALLLAKRVGNKVTQDQHLRLALKLDSVNADDIYVGFDKKASTAYTINEDARYRYGQGKVSLNSRSSDNVELAINITALPKKGQVIPLSAYATADGTYTFNMTELKNMPVVYDVWLKDAYRKDSLDMRHNAVYTFNIAHADTSSFGKNRFTLFIKKDPLRDVHLLSFAAGKQGNGVKTIWTVENEEDYTGFSLQRSTDGVNFSLIDTLQSASLGTYSFVDDAPKQANYYRLQLTDVTGDITYSGIVPLLYGAAARPANSVSIYPNPTRGTLNVAVSQGSIAAAGLNQGMAGTAAAAGVNRAAYDIRITGMTGEIVKSVTSVSATWQNDVSSLLPGTYVIQVMDHTSGSIVGRAAFVKL